jgi:hypothetical protein
MALGNKVEYQRRAASGAASNGLYNTIKCLLGAGGIGLGIRIKYLRGAAAIGLGLV